MVSVQKFKGEKNFIHGVEKFLYEFNQIYSDNE